MSLTVVALFIIFYVLGNLKASWRANKFENCNDRNRFSLQVHSAYDLFIYMKYTLLFNPYIKCKYLWKIKFLQFEMSI